MPDTEPRRRNPGHVLLATGLLAAAAIAALTSQPAHAYDCAPVPESWAAALCDPSGLAHFGAPTCEDCAPELADIAFVTVMGHTPVERTEPGGAIFETRLQVARVVRSDGSPGFADEMIIERRHGEIAGRYALIIDPTGRSYLLKRDHDRIHLYGTSMSVDRFLALAGQSPPCVLADIPIGPQPCEEPGLLCAGGSTPPLGLLLVLLGWTAVRCMRALR